MKKRILIPYASYGSGHQTIANYIADYFATRDDYEILTIDLLKYSTPILGSVSKKLFESIMHGKFTFIFALIYELFDHRLSSLGTTKLSMQMFHNKRIKKIITDFNPDLTIATHFFGSELIAMYNKSNLTKSKIITIVTDYKAHEFWLKNAKYDDYIVVSSEEEKKQLMKRKILNDKIKTFGIPVSTKFTKTYNRDKLLKSFSITGLRPIVLFFGGGVAKGNLALFPYYKKAVKTNPNMDFIFIAGNNKKMYNKVKDFNDENNVNNVRVLGFTNKMAEILSITDLVITKPGGASVTECLVTKTPMILIGNNQGQERDNTRYIVNNGYGFKARAPYFLAKILRGIDNDLDILDTIKNNMKKNENDKAIIKLYNLSIKLMANK